MTEIETQPAAVLAKNPDRHLDVFTPIEAAVYLGFETKRSLETLREHYGLIGQRVGKHYLYHREDLDACVLRMFGKDVRRSPGK